MLYGKDIAFPIVPAVLLCDCHEFFNFIKVSFSGYLFSRQFSRTHIWSECLNWVGGFGNKNFRIMNI